MNEGVRKKMVSKEKVSTLFFIIHQTLPYYFG